MRSLRLRLLLTVLGAIGFGFALAGVTVGRFVAASIGREFDSRLEQIADALSAAADFTSEGELELTRIPDAAVFSQQRSGWYWMIADSERVLMRSRSLWTDRLVLDGVEPGRSGFIAGPNGERLRAVVREATPGDRMQPLAIAVAAPAAFVEDEVRGVVTQLVLLLAFIGGASVIAVGLLVNRGLAPLRRAADSVDRVARGEIPSLAPSGYREVDPLVQAVNGLLAHARETVGRSRLQASNLAHALKTPLAFISARVHATTPEDRSMTESVERMTRLIDHRLRRARFAATAPLLAEPVPVKAAIDDVVLVAQRLHGGRQHDVRIRADEATNFLGEREDLEELLSNLVDNAFKWAAHRIDIGADQADGRVVLMVADDGPGLDEGAREKVMQPGVRLDEAAAGSGLGLSIAAEIVEHYGGKLSLDRSPLGGLQVSVRLPAASPTIASPDAVAAH